MTHALVRLLGWRATILQGDPSVVDRWRWLRSHLRPGALKTLDAGCGSGAYSFYAARLGNDVLGLSFDEANDRKARERAALLGLPNARFRRVDLRVLDTISGELGQFDQIICLETIEHILDDRKLVRDLARLLAPGGRLLLTAPYKHYRPLRGDHVTPVEDGGHVRWGYTHDEMRQLFESSGLRVVATEYITGMVTQKLMNLTRALAPRLGGTGAWAATFPLRVLQLLDAPLTRLAGYPALSIGVVGVKPA